MFALSPYDQACLDQYSEYNRLFSNADVLNTLAWQQELCHEHLRTSNDAKYLEYEARIGRLHGTKFDSTITQAQFQILESMFHQSKWFQTIDSDVILTQDTYYVDRAFPEGTCRTRVQYHSSSKPLKVEHLWKRKLSSVTVEHREAKTNEDTLAIRVELNQEVPIVFDDETNESMCIRLCHTQFVKSERVRFKWTKTYQYESPQTGLVWQYHLHRVLEGQTKCEAEQKFRELPSTLRYECECECVNFLKMWVTPSPVHMTPIVYLFESFVVKLQDWIRSIRSGSSSSYGSFVCVQARLNIGRVEELYWRFRK